jgi:hypothetical protein
MENRMVIVPWPVTDINFWVVQAEALIARWPELTGRICPSCGAKALVGHGQRQRSVHVGETAGKRGPECGVIWFWVQRVRCTACGKTHTLLPAFLAPYQRHASRVRGEASAAREAGASWGQVLQRLALPMLSTSSVRRWVRGVMLRIPAMAEAVARWRAAGAQGAVIAYGSVAAPGTFGGLVTSVGRLMAQQVVDWPDGEAIAGANWQAARRRSALTV